MQNFYSEKLTLQQISKIPFFEGLNQEMLKDFINILEIDTFRKGERIFEEGDIAESMFFILDGSIRIIKKNSRGEEKFLVEISAPQFFGEIALIDRGKRSTGVIAANDLTVAVLYWDRLDRAFEAYNPELAIFTYKKIAQTLCLRLRRANAMYAHITSDNR